MLGTTFAVVTMLAAGAAAAPERAQVMAPIRQFVDGFNAGDAKTALAACASPAAVVDEIPPYAWQGPTACEDWAKDFEAWAKEHAVTDVAVRLGKPSHVDVAGDRAYVVLPAGLRFKQGGKARSQAGATFTVSLVKAAEGWRISAWSWASGRPR